LAYEVFISRDANFSQIVLTQTVNQREFTPSTPLADGIYFMRVRAYNSNLSPGKFSKTFTFTLDSTPPAVPMLISPSNTSTSQNRPTLQWTLSDGAAQYQIEMDSNPDFSSVEYREATTKTSIRTKSLSKGTTYYWRVRAKDRAGNWSDWSTSYSVTVR